MSQQHKTQTRSSYPIKWNLKLLYTSPTDPQIQTDLETYNKKRAIFAQKYVDRTDYLRSEEQLNLALTEYEQLLNDLSGAKPLMYFHYLTAISSNNRQAQAQLNKITTQLTKAFNQLAFFPIKLGKIDKALQTKFINSDKLAKYQYFLSKRFELAQYDLEEDQEKLLNLVDQTSYQMWVEGVTKTINKLIVNWKGKKLPLSEASQMIAQLPTQQRRELHKKMLTKASTLKEFAESEINAIVTHKSIEDELRGFKQPYTARILGSENDIETIKMLVEVVTQNFNLAHRFYQIKAKLLKLPSLTYADRNAKIDQVKRQYDFTQAKKLVSESFLKLHPKFDQIFSYMLQAGQLDIFPRQNKVGGAFCSNSTNNPTFVLLNHTNDLDSVTTLAHEMGHAIHSELSKKQPVLYQNYSTSTAETASTFFEQFVFERLIQDFTAQEKVVALHNKLQDDINTIFRQTALFNFELELHQQVREVGYLDYDQIGNLLNKHMQNYMGPAVNLSKFDGRFFILWPHIRNFFYTYTYAFGHLISKAMIKQVKQDPSSIKKVIEFLSAGGSARPKDILKKVDIDISQPQFFQQGISTIEDELNQLETYVK